MSTSLLDRVALNQTRLRTPGLSLDGKGVALGAKGLVLLPSLDRLVTMLALYTSEASLESLVPSLGIDVVKSSLGHREVVIAFNVDGTERLDSVAETARLAGGFTFTGTSRQFVQYRDAGAPFGYDVRELTPTDAALTLNHSRFQQTYAVERSVALSDLLLKLEPRLAPEMSPEQASRCWILADSGLGAALIHYFVRSRVDANVGIAQWPPASAFDELPVERHLFQVKSLPKRMLKMLRSTPGIGVFVDTTSGCAIEFGFEHPVNLRACPVFDKEQLVLVQGRGKPPLVVNPVPQLGPVHAFSRVEMLDLGAQTSLPTDADITSVSVKLALAAQTREFEDIVASWIKPEEFDLLRQLCYRLSTDILRRTLVAMTPTGAFIFSTEGIDSIPIGELFSRIHPNIFVSAGRQIVPDVAPEIVHAAFGSPERSLVFVSRDGQRIGIERSAFRPLEQVLLGNENWQEAADQHIAEVVATPIPMLTLESPGFRAMRDVEELP